MNQEQESQMTSEVENQSVTAGEAAESNEENQSVEPATPVHSGPTPGEILKAERERQNLSLEDVVSQSRMTMETVRALEEGRDPPQNAWVYVRGYYRKYARVLGLSEDEILSAHEKMVGGAPEPQPLSTEWAPQDVSPGGGVPRIVLVLIAGIILGGLIWLFLSGEKKDDEGDRSRVSVTSSVTESKAQSATATPRSAAVIKSAEVTQKTLESTTESPGALDGDGTTETLTGEEVSTLEESGTAVEDSASNTQAVEEVSPGSAHEAGMSGAEPRLGVEFVDNSWVNIVDATGKKLLDGIVQAGAEFALKGQAPYRVFLGYAPGVKMSYGGQMIDIEPYITSNNTARFKVGEASQ